MVVRLQAEHTSLAHQHDILHQAERYLQPAHLSTANCSADTKITAGVAPPASAMDSVLGPQQHPAPQSSPADLSRSKPCSRPFLISNIMGLPSNEVTPVKREPGGEAESEVEEGGSSPPSPPSPRPGQLGSPGGSPGPDSGSEIGCGDE